MTNHSDPSPETLKRIIEVLGPQGYLTKARDTSPYLTEPRERWVGRTSLVARPSTTEEVAKVVKICAETNTPIVPQSGNTGLVGGQIPTGPEILLSLNRLNQVRQIDSANSTITVEAGIILENLQNLADQNDRLFPLSLASEGSAQIGGLLSTNAGGNAVLRYGPMRDLVLGLEVVTPQGEIWNGLTGLRKDNTGYDLKQLFIGAEGTLGIITAATLKLFPKPVETATALVAIRDIEAAIELLALARKESGDQVSAFELLPLIGLKFVTEHIPNTRPPLSEEHDWHILLEYSSSSSTGMLRSSLETVLEQAYEAGLVLDAALAESEKQRAELWMLRESLPEAQKSEGVSLKHDISVPVSAIPKFMAQALAEVSSAVPGIRPVPFGHIGDGNIHFNLSEPSGGNSDRFAGKRTKISQIVHDIVQSLNGSISAEHGIGIAKRDEMLTRKSSTEVEMMRSVKKALDPQGIMNPGKLI
jgi:FAD/FMN-containing dehydrogenase